MTSFDSWGFAGLALDYAVILFFSGGALILFLYCWKKGHLNLDEEAKYQMLNEESGNE